MLEFDQLDEKQRQAVHACCNFVNTNQIYCVSGSAGTGKTSIAKHVYDKATEKGLSVALCATTGKAARRLREATGIATQTVHALLEFPTPGELCPKTGKPLMQGVPARCSLYPLTYDVVLIDEASMLTWELLGYLFDAMPKSGFVRLFGDHRQLQPIEVNGEEREKDYESVFRKYRNKNGIVLEAIYRQTEGSGIISNASRVLQGHAPLKAPDFIMMPCFDQTRAICDIVKRNPDYLTTKAQIITPQARGVFGTHHINDQIQRLYNQHPEKQVALERYEHHPHAETGLVVGIGDKVIMNKNWYIIEPDGIMNGEIGIVRDITEQADLIIEFDFGMSLIPSMIEGVNRHEKQIILNPQKDLELAYAITTHKSQGSEWSEITYAIDVKQGYVLCRANTYTGITRARQKVNFVYKTAAMTGCLSEIPIWKQKKGGKK